MDSSYLRAMSWDTWRQNILPYGMAAESTTWLQTVLKTLRISSIIRMELNSCIDYLLGRRLELPMPQLSPLDRIFMIHILFGTLEEVQKFVAKNQLSFEHLQTLEPIKYHANQYDKDLYRDDLIQWLIDNGLDAKGSIVDQWHLENRSLARNIYLLAHGASLQIRDMSVFKSVAEFSQYWKYCNKHDVDLISKLVSNLTRSRKNDLKTSERAEFVMQMYKSGSANSNYFKSLPSEIIQHICSYGLDQSFWWELSAILVKHAPDGSLKIDFGWYHELRFNTLEFIWTYWHKLCDETKTKVASDIQNVIFNVEPNVRCEALLKLLRLPNMVNKFPNPETHVAPRILGSAMYTPHVMSLDVVKTLVETQPYSPGLYRCSTTDRVPAVWETMLNDNRVVIEYLISIDSWPMVSEWGDKLTFEQWTPSRKINKETVAFVYECRKKYNLDLTKD